MAGNYPAGVKDSDFDVPSVEDEAEPEPVWIVFDGRAIGGDTDDASVLESLSPPRVRTDAQAIRSAKRMWRGYEFALYRYDMIDGAAQNERLIYVGRI